MKMKSCSLALASLLAVSLATSAKADVIAGWTFETSQPGIVTLPAAPGAGVAFTGFSPEVGSGTATALHATSATYSSPSGNISARSFSANNWSVGDYFQFQVSSIGFSGIGVSFDQTGSGTGPSQFVLQYSTDGSTFSPFGSPYSVLLNGAPNPSWSAATGGPVYSYSFNLSAITALDNDASIFFRIVDNSTTSINGGTVAAGGTDRLDNFVVSGTLVPEPSAFALVGMGVLALRVVRRKQ